MSESASSALSASAPSNIVLVIDFGPKHTHSITKTIRNLSFFSLWIDEISAIHDINKLNPRVIILSGGPRSETSAGLPAWLLNYVKKEGVYVLGIGYGMQLILNNVDGEMTVAEENKYYEKVEIEVVKSCGSFMKKSTGPKQFVRMSHGYKAMKLPEGFEVMVKTLQESDSESVAVVVANRERRIYGFHYNVEVSRQLLGSFLSNICGVAAAWNMKDCVNQEIKMIKETVGPNQHVICPLYGDVNSTVAAAIIHNAIGDRLHCVFVDTGLLRYKEKERVEECFEDLKLPYIIMNESKNFLKNLKGVIDTETKWDKIGREFKRVFCEFIKGTDNNSHTKSAFFVQGTLYSDAIYSDAIKPCSLRGIGKFCLLPITSHPKVKGIPTEMNLKLIQPLKLLFKEEVCEVGKILGIPKAFLRSHPLTEGTGIALQVLGDVTLEKRLDILRQAEEIFIDTLKGFEIYDDILQAFAVLLNCKPTLVQGNPSFPIVLHATSTDEATKDGYTFDYNLLNNVATKIGNEVEGVDLVLLDITTQSRATFQ